MTTKPTSEAAKITDKLLAAKEAASTGTTPPTPSERKPYRQPRPKRTKPAGPAKLNPIEIGGVSVHPDVAIEALETLRQAPGIMVRQPLAKAGNPLAKCDYHGFANEVRASDPKLADLKTKEAFIAGIARLTGR
jgi:hypothetical protein